MFTRRDFVRNLALAAGYSLLPLGRHGWAFASAGPVQRRLVVIMLRGAIDGLSVVVPYSEANYYNSRSTIALARPGQAAGVLDLDGFFGLHPSLGELMPLWRNKTLAFVHASGSPAATRSHFEAQDIMEAASTHISMAPPGWMNTLAQLLPDTHSSTRALSFGNVLPKIFEGPFNVATIPTGIKNNGQGGGKLPNPQMNRAFAQLYAGHPELGGLYQEGTSARAAIMSDLPPEDNAKQEMEVASKDAVHPDAFITQSQKIAAIIRHDPAIELVFTDVGGWDTHVNQGNADGELGKKLQKLGTGLSALATGLGPEFRNTTVLVMSEFGRTVAENGNHGTDHGHGNVMWVMGGNVSGGKIWGRWPGLAPTQLYEGRDLAVTTDFRAVIGEVLHGHFGLGQTRIARVLADYKPDDGLRGLV